MKNSADEAIEGDNLINFCPKCEKYLNLNFKFCPHCGARPLTKDLKNLEFKRIAFLNKFHEDPAGAREASLAVYMPQICLFCGSPEIAGEVKIRNQGHSTPKGVAMLSLSVLACSSHVKLNPKNPKYICKKFLIGAVIMLLGILLVPIPFLSFVPMMGGMIYIMYHIFHYAQGEADKKLSTEEYVLLESFEEKSVISVKNPVWAEEFVKLNACKRIHDVDQSKIEKSKEKRRSMRIFIGASFGAEMALLITFLSLRLEFLYYIVLIPALVVSIMGFVFIEIYFEVLEIPRLKHEAYFQEEMEPRLRPSQIIVLMISIGILTFFAIITMN